MRANRAMLLGVSVTVLGLGLGAPSARAEDVPCPGGTRDVPLEGVLFRANPTKPHPVTMAPCETLVVSVSGAIVGQPAMGLSVQVALKNEDGVTLASQSGWCYVTAGCAFMLPLASSASGTPLPGTAGAAGRVASVVVTLSLPPYTTVGVDYTGTAVFTSRPGFNTGSPTLATAPLLAASPASISGSLHYLEAGQYSRVRLRAGGTLQVTGWLGITCTPCYGGAFSVAVFTSGGTYVSTIGSRGYGSNYGPSVPFTSSVFTNTTGQPAEFVLRLKVAVNPTPTLAEFALTVTWAEGPRLTLFLDREPNDPGLGFNAADPESDADTYVPGAEATGASVPLDEAPTPSAQAMELIAAYVDDAGAIAPPPSYAPASVTFVLEETSAFRGYAMNAGESTAPDFSLSTPAAAFGADHTARTALSCHDYGGFTTVTVTDGPATTPGLRLPAALADDWLPAAGWRAFDGVAVEPAGLSSDQDADPSPDVVFYPVIPYGLVGDGLTAYEEFRGFLVGGSHRRLDPRRKDLFVTRHLDYGIGYATNLPVVVHQIDSPDEHDGGLINTRAGNAGAGGAVPTAPQKALVVSYDLTSDSPGLMALTNPQMEFRVPLDVDSITILVKSHLVYLLAPAGYCGQTAEDPPCHSLEQATNELRRTIAHEVGHGIGICHFGGCSSALNEPPARSPTVMHSGVFLGPPISAPESNYDQFEQGLIRLHKR